MKTMQTIRLPSGRQIGDGEPPFIIAEVGSNWRSLEDCLTSIAMAKACGADAVKFQLFNPVALYGDIPAVWDMPIKTQGEAPYMPFDFLPKLKAEADRVGIEFMCSAFSPELVRAVDPFVNIHKVASAELSHVRILETLQEIGKPVILSTGASGVEDIHQALNVLTGQYQSEKSDPYFDRQDGQSKYGGVPVVLLYCVASYPANEVALDTLPILRGHFHTLCGYSDHTLDVLEIPKRAIQLGACVVEKHFNALAPDIETPDSPHSLGVNQFKRMVDSIRGHVEPRIGPSREENDMVTTHNRRLIATRDIKPGDTLVEGQNFGIYRSLKKDAKALSPFLIDRVEGKIAKNAIQAGDGIGPSDI